MGTTLDAVLEVYHPPVEYSSGAYSRGGWDDVAAWSFNKDYKLMHALSGTSLVVPFEYWEQQQKYELSMPLQHAADADIYTTWQLATPAAYRVALAYRQAWGYEGEGEEWKDWANPTARALCAAMESLVSAFGEERVRIIFCQCT